MSAADVVLPDGSRFHHIGLACRELEAELAGVSVLGYEPVGVPFTDPQQGITGVFVEGVGPRLELLAPLAGSTVLDPWLRGGSRMYHLAYEVAELDAAVAGAEAQGARVVSDPVASVAFDQRRICFLMLRVRLLTELIELGR